MRTQQQMAHYEEVDTIKLMVMLNMIQMYLIIFLHTELVLVTHWNLK